MAHDLNISGALGFRGFAACLRHRWEVSRKVLWGLVAGWLRADVVVLTEVSRLDVGACGIGVDKSALGASGLGASLRRAISPFSESDLE